MPRCMVECSTSSSFTYGEPYKVVDPFDVVLVGTMHESLLEYVKKEKKAHNQAVLMINKCDLVLNWVTVGYLPRWN